MIIDPRGIEGGRPIEEDRGRKDRGLNAGDDIRVARVNMRANEQRDPPPNLVAIYASGCPRCNALGKPIENDKQEIAACKAGIMLAWSGDFEKTVEIMPENWQKYPASRISEFFGALERAQGPLSRIAFVGHGYRDEIRFAGGAVNEGKTLGSQDLEEYKENIVEKIKPKILKNTTIDLYTCGSAQQTNLMQAMANAFGCRVRGFRERLAWCVCWDATETRLTRSGLIAPASTARSNSTCREDYWKRADELEPPVIVDHQSK
jgi:hypothetical protein